MADHHIRHTPHRQHAIISTLVFRIASSFFSQTVLTITLPLLGENGDVSNLQCARLPLFLLPLRGGGLFGKFVDGRMDKFVQQPFTEDEDSATLERRVRAQLASKRRAELKSAGRVAADSTERAAWDRLLSSEAPQGVGDVEPSQPRPLPAPAEQRQVSAGYGSSAAELSATVAPGGGVGAPTSALHAQAICCCLCPRCVLCRRWKSAAQWPPHRPRTPLTSGQIRVVRERGGGRPCLTRCSRSRARNRPRNGGGGAAGVGGVDVSRGRTTWSRSGAGGPRPGRRRACWSRPRPAPRPARRWSSGGGPW